MSETMRLLQHLDESPDLSQTNLLITKIDGIRFYSTEQLDEAEISQYVRRGQNIFGKYIDYIYADVDGEYIDLYYKLRPDAPPFERIRRITGYLVGTLDRFNDGKRAEESDRVKHNIKGSHEKNLKMSGAEYYDMFHD